jgi:O-methyltransferase
MSDIIDIKDSLMQLPTFSVEIHNRIIPRDDYFRYATLGLAVQRILTDDIMGSFAEVGVYRGHMSAFIHALAPERKYYLFDTFEGFPIEDVEFAGHSDMFKDTSVELVLKNIGNTENIVIRKGYIPDTLAGLEDEQFAFALLDLDLYIPTKRSLEFFYPRLVSGGYLAVHDYNNPPNPSILVNRAVNEFMHDKPERIIEIADKWGSVVLRKF